MNIKHKFILFFTTFIIMITSILGYIGYFFINAEIDLFVSAPNKEFISIMADQLLLKSLISFVSITLLVTILSLFIGLFLFKLISNSFLKSVQKITGLASERIDSKNSKNEVEILQKYIELVIDDQKKLQEFEKINSWKDGARLLIHEIKNPLTPLKLSLENLMIKDIKEYEDDLVPAIASTKDIENILKNFKNLVNIEYEPITKVDFKSFCFEFESQIILTYPALEIKKDFSSDSLIIYSEANLLKILISNLINNGIEANPLGFTTIFTEDENSIMLKFITQDRFIKDIDRCFIMGHSDKGNNRGYGLFLCKMLADYLDIRIETENSENSVLFTLIIKKEQL